MKFVAAVITFLPLVIAGVTMIFFLMLGLNGFSSADGGTALTFYALWIGCCAIGMAAASFWLSGYFVGKSWTSGKAVAAAVVLTLTFGIAAEVFGFFVSVLTADYLREKRIEQRKQERLAP